MLEFFTSPMFLGFVLGMFAVMLLRGLFGNPSEERMEKAKEYMERLSPDMLETVKTNLRDNNKIEALRIIRAETNIGLKEAQDVVKFLKKSL